MLKTQFLPHSARLLFVLAVALVFAERPLHAYADPGSGLLMWQLLGAFFFGAMFQARRVFNKLRSLGQHRSAPPPRTTWSER
jgi:hypothetical protein